MLLAWTKLVTTAALALGAAVLAAAKGPIERQEGKPPVDLYGDALPPHAVARLCTLRFRWATGIEQAVAVPGGKHLLGLGHSSTVVMWDAATGKAVRRFDGPTRRPARKEDGVPFPDVSFGSFADSPDGKTLVAATTDDSGLDWPMKWIYLSGCRDKHSFGSRRGAVNRPKGPMSKEPQAPSAWAIAVGLSNLPVRRQGF